MTQRLYQGVEGIADVSESLAPLTKPVILSESAAADESKDLRHGHFHGLTTATKKSSAKNAA